MIKRHWICAHIQQAFKGHGHLQEGHTCTVFLLYHWSPNVHTKCVLFTEGEGLAYGYLTEPCPKNVLYINIKKKFGKRGNFIYTMLTVNLKKMLIMIKPVSFITSFDFVLKPVLFKSSLFVLIFKDFVCDLLFLSDFLYV